jgi:hypothetical protein
LEHQQIRERKGEKVVKKDVGEVRHLAVSYVAKSERQIGLAAVEVGQAAISFEARWTYHALRRTNPELADKLSRQVQVWYDIKPSGDEERVLKIARSLVRGYELASAAMLAVDHPDDAYEVVMTDRGRVITFGPKSCAEYLAGKYPGSAHYTFEEAAELLAGMGDQAFPLTKSLFPGAEIMPVRDAARIGSASTS